MVYLDQGMKSKFPGVFTKYPATRNLRIRFKNLSSEILFLKIDIRILWSMLGKHDSISPSMIKLQPSKFLRIWLIAVRHPCVRHPIFRKRAIKDTI